MTKAIYDYWEYFEPIRLNGPPDCISTTQKLINVVDNIIIEKKDQELTKKVKDLFGLGDIKDIKDFGNTISTGVTGWQSRNWDPALSNPTFDYYCGNITAPDLVHPDTRDLEKDAKEIISAGGYGKEIDSLTTRLLNFVGFVKASQISSCSENKISIDDCFTTYNTTHYQLDDLSQTWRSWPYQYCTE